MPGDHSHDESTDDEYLTAEEGEEEEEGDVECNPFAPIAGFIVWTSDDGTMWYLPNCDPETI